MERVGNVEDAKECFFIFDSEDEDEENTDNEMKQGSIVQKTGKLRGLFLG